MLFCYISLFFCLFVPLSECLFVYLSVSLFVIASLLCTVCPYHPYIRILLERFTASYFPGFSGESDHVGLKQFTISIGLIHKIFKIWHNRILNFHIVQNH